MTTIVPGPILVGGGGAGTFVYRPGGVAADNVYTDWATMMTAVNAAEGLRTIQFDDSLGTVTIPAGVWDMTDVIWAGPPISPFAQADRVNVNVSEGATLPGLRRISGGMLILNNATATTPLTINDADPLRLEGVQLSQGTGTVPFVEFTFAVFGTLVLANQSSVNPTDDPVPNVLWSAGFPVLILEDGKVGPSSVNNTSGNAMSVLMSNLGGVAQGFQTTGVDPFLDFTQFSTFRMDVNRALSTDAARSLAPLNFAGAAPFMDLFARQDTTAANHTVTLANPEDRPGQIQGVANEAGANEVTVQPVAGQSIDSVVDKQVVLAAGEAALFISDGTSNWTTIARISSGGGGGGGGLTLEGSASAGNRTASQNTFTRVDATAGDVTITMPATGDSGDRVAVHNEVGANDVIVAPDTGDSLDGVVDGTLTIPPGAVVTFIWDGTSAWVYESRSYREQLGTLSDPIDAIRIKENGVGVILDNVSDALATRLYSPAAESWRINQVGSPNNYVAGNSGGDDFRVVRSNGLLFGLDSNRVRGKTAGTTALGELAAPFSTLYLGEGGTGVVLDADGDTYIFAPVDDNIDFFTGTVRQLRITQTEIQNFRQVTTFSNIAPNSVGTQDVGSLARPYRALYLSEAGTGLVLDTDGDSLISATADDVVEIEAGSTTKLEIIGTGNAFRFNTGSQARFAMDTNAMRPITAGAVDLGTLAVPWGALYLDEGGTGLVLDADGDTYLVGSADDQAQWFFGGVRRATWGSGSFDFNIPLRPESNNGTTIGGDFRGWASLYLGDAGTYVTAVSEVAPAQPNAQAVIFHATGPASAKELWVRHSDGTLAQLDAAGGGGTDEDVKVSANDTTAGKLIDKLVAGSGVTLTETDDGSNETLEVAATAATATPNYMLAGLSTDVSVAEGSRIPFDITAKSGPAIAMGTDGLFTLQPNRTYEIHVSIDPVVNESMVYSRLYNATLNLPLVDDVGSDSKIIGTGDAGSASDTGITGSSFAVFTPTVSTNIEVRREAGTDSLLQDMRTGTRILIREMTQPVPGTGGVATDHLQLQDTGSPSLPASGSPFTFDIELSNKGGGDAISYNSTTGVLTLKAGWMHKLEAWIRGVSNSSEVYKYRFYDLTNLAFIGTESFGQDQNRNVSAAEGGEAKVAIRPTTDIEVELRATDTNTGTYSGDLSSITVTSVRGGSIGRSIDGAVGSAPGGSYATSKIDYLELRQGQADTIGFQLVANGNFALDVYYAMSVANAGDVNLRMDRLVVTDGDDPDVALAAGTVDTFVPGANTTRQTAVSANFEVLANAGDEVRILLERPNTDTHTGDVRVLDIRVRPT